MSHISCTDTNRFRSVVCPSHCGITVSLIMHEHHLFPKSCVSTSHFSVSEHARRMAPSVTSDVCPESHSLRSYTGTSRIHRAVRPSRCSLRTCTGTSCIHRAVCSSHYSLRTCGTGTNCIHRAVCPSQCSLRTCGTGTNCIHRAVCPSQCSLRTCTGTNCIHRAVCSSHCSLRTCTGTNCIHGAVCPSHCSLRTCTGTNCIHGAVCPSHCSLRTCTGTNCIHGAVCPSHCSLRTCMMHGLSRSSETCGQDGQGRRLSAGGPATNCCTIGVPRSPPTTPATSLEELSPPSTRDKLRYYDYIQQLLGCIISLN